MTEKKSAWLSLKSTWQSLIQKMVQSQGFILTVSFATLVGVFMGIYTFVDARSATKMISGTLVQIDQNLTEASTQAVEVYPGNIDNIIKDIFDYCSENPRVERLEIYTDVIGYAMLTDNCRWNKYWNAITNLTNNEANKNLSLKWCYYEDGLRQTINEKQFSRYENNPITLKAFLKKVKENLKSNCDKCTYGNCPHANDASRECRLINKMKDYQTFSDNLEILQKEKYDALEALKLTKKNKEIITIPWGIEFPFHAWFVIDSEGNPIRGVITYPTHQGGISSETGLYIKDKRILQPQYNIMQEKEQLVLQSKN